MPEDAPRLWLPRCAYHIGRDRCRYVEHDGVEHLLQDFDYPFDGPSARLYRVVEGSTMYAYRRIQR